VVEGLDQLGDSVGYNDMVEYDHGLGDLDITAQAKLNEHWKVMEL
jgi:hypothetical protein